MVLTPLLWGELSRVPTRAASKGRVVPDAAGNAVGAAATTLLVALLTLLPALSLLALALLTSLLALLTLALALLPASSLLALALPLLALALPLLTSLLTLALLTLTFLTLALLARCFMQWARAPFRNPLGEFIFAVTDWAVKPARRVIPSAFGVDLPSLLLAWLTQVILHGLLMLLSGSPISSPGPLRILRLKSPSENFRETWIILLMGRMVWDASTDPKMTASAKAKTNPNKIIFLI